MIHSDLHHGNFYYHNGQIWVFDFDDCSNHWFASDLAIPLHYLMWSFEQKGVTAPNDYAVKFMRELLNGYETENQLRPADIDAIPLFLKLRDLSLYSFFYLKNKDKKLNKLVVKIEQRIKENQPIVHFDSNIGIR